MGIGFFAPLPLAMMLPFMAGQSMIMGESFGKGFQYGKRKISSMSNEEFNKMDANTLGRELATDYTTIIPHLEQAVRASSDFQQMIIQELIKIIPNFVDQLLGGGAVADQGTGVKIPPAGIPAFITLPAGPPPSTIIDNPQINPPPSAARKYNANETWALRWIDPIRNVVNFGTATFQEVSYMAQLRADNQSAFFPELKSLGASLLTAYNKKKPKAKTPEEIQTGISTNAPAGSDVWKIATMLLSIKEAFRLRKPNREIIVLMSAFNQFVTSTRNPATGKTFANLQLDTAKSLQARKPIPKT